CIYDFQFSFGSISLDFPLAVLVVSAAMAFSTREESVPFSQLVKNYWHVLFFCMVTVLVTFYSVNRSHSLAVQPQLMPSLLVFVVITQFVKTRAHIEFLLIGIVLAGVLVCCNVLYMLYTVEADHPLHKINQLKWPLFIAPNDVLMLSIIAPLAAGLLFLKKQWFWRCFSVFYLLFALIIIVLLESRQALAVYSVAIGFFFLLMRPWLGLVVLVILLCGGLLADHLLGGVLVKKLFLFPRIYLWHTAWEMFLDRPLFGQGPGMFKELYREYLPRAGYVFEELSDRRPMNWAHSLYIEQLAERGVAGFIALLLLLGKPVLALLNQYREVRGAECRVIIMALMGGFLAFLLSGIAEASLVRLWVVPVMFFLLSLASAVVCLKER
ncbi:MAG: O-antigen ligase family protein, partial [Pseudomonadales bacterium]|nr:O-antigen ligase family protein [Pseudomonadales bacterium]